MTDTFEIRLQEVFARAVELPAAERAAHLDRACAGDPQLRARVETLLSAHDRAGRFLATPAVAHSGERIGRYTLLETIGEGGFAVVYRAQQTDPIRRDVALKIVKLGMDTKQVIARFEAERQALAILDHPNIAKVFDAGTTDTGRPYFVMELVAGGVPITSYCDQHSLSPRERLELFVPICQAVQHAHQKGIIHRDIKPNNVLVAIVDGKSVPKVIDFGIAKAIDSRATQRTMFTELGQLIGTPAYMSPEQAGFGASDVDTRSDVYSLGVLLYELLTGTTPIEERALRIAAYDQIQKIVREYDPPAPSTRVTSMGDAAASVAAVRKVELKALSRTIRGEIDWIVMKCLEKNRARRYDSASALSADIRRHLSGELVAAGPLRRGYRLRKFARRYRVAIAIGTTIATAVIIALVVSLLALAREKRALALANAANESATEVTNLALTRTFSDDRTELVFRQAYERILLAYGPDHPMSINAEINLGVMLGARSKPDEADLHLRQALERSRRVMGPTADVKILSLAEIISLRSRLGRIDTTVEFNRELHQIVLDPKVPTGMRVYFAPWFGGCLTVLHRYAEARQPLLEALAILQTNHGPRDKIRGVMQNLAEGCDALGLTDESQKWRREIATIESSPATQSATQPSN